MANKEYSMMFKLTAQAGREFSSAFSSASQQMAQLQKEIAALNQSQADISAYQKQQTAVENTKRKLEDLKQQYENIKREYQETGEQSSALANKMIDKQRAIDQTNAKLEQQTSKLDAMESELKEAGIDTENLTQEQQRLASEMDKAAVEMEEAGQNAEEYGSTGSEAIQAVGAAIVAAGIATKLKEIAEAYKECVSLSMEFEATMSTVEALSGASSEEMGALQVKAKQLGAETAYTATEAAEAMTYMGMAGWDAEQMLSGMSGVINLAAASGEDLARVSDIVTDNLTAFGMKASDTAHFSDVLAAAATNSNTSVSIMGETFKKSAPVAGALGYSIEDVAVAVGLMANAGVKGSRAGTALSNTFTGLLGGVKLTGEAIGEVEYSAMNADGTMKSFGDTIDGLRAQFDQMTEAEKTNNAMAIAGKQGYAGLLAVLNATDEDYASLRASIEGCSGAAEKMAEIKLDNLQGQMTLLNSATDALKTTIGEAYRNEMTGFVKIATQMVSGINEFLTAHPNLVKALIAGAAALGTVVAGITAYVAISKVASAVTAALATTMSVTAPQLTLIAGGIMAVVAAGTYLVSVAKDLDNGYRELTEESKENLDQLHEAEEAYADAAEQYGENSSEAQSLRWQVEYLTEEYESNKQTVEEYTQAHIEASEAISQEADAAMERLHNLENEGTYSSALVDRLSELAGQSHQTAAAQSEMAAIVAKLNEEMPELDLNLKDVLSGGYDFSSVEAMAKAKVEAELFAEAQETIVEQYKAREQANKEVTEAEKKLAAAQQDYQAKIAAYKNQWGEDQTGFGMWFSQTGKDLRAAEDAVEAYKEQVEAAKEAQKDANEAYNEAADVLGEYSGVVDGATEAEQAAITTITNTVSELQELKAAYTEAYEAAKESFDGQFELFDKAEADMDATVSKAQEALNSQLEYWKSYNSNIETLKNTSAEALGVTQEQYDSLMSYVQNGTEEAAGLAASMASAIENGNTEAVATLAETMTEVETARDTAAQNVAEWTTGFNQSMDEMVNRANQTIDELELSAEARSAAQATMQAYAQQILSEGAAAVANAKSIAQQVSAALSSANASSSGSSGGSSSKGYASGTESATPGVHLVGEEGPELVYFEGGESVIPASETASMMNKINTPAVESLSADNSVGGVNVTLTVNVTGGGEATDQIQQAGESLKAQLADMLEDYMSDRNRRVYR